MSDPIFLMSERRLVPKSSIGQELHNRFKELAFRTNPGDSPMARALVAHGYHVIDHPLYPQYTDTDWLASSVSIKGLNIVFRQPTPEDLLVCFIKRELTDQKMSSALLGIAEFFSFCRYDCPGLKYVGGNIDKHASNAKKEATKEDGQLEMDRLVAFYNRILGDVESYEENGIFSIYAEVHRDRRFEEFPIWKRCRRKNNINSKIHPTKV